MNGVGDFIVDVDVFADGGLQLLHTANHATANPLVGEFSERRLDQVDPGSCVELGRMTISRVWRAFGLQVHAACFPESVRSLAPPVHHSPAAALPAVGRRRVLPREPAEIDLSSAMIVLSAPNVSYFGVGSWPGSKHWSRK
jgi:hypothetical protein